MGSVDKILFLLSRGGDTLIVQIYVDDIVGPRRATRGGVNRST